MTNKEWLDYLAQNAPDELSAWFDAEHVENKERTLESYTEPQNADSRELLEAEIRYEYNGAISNEADEIIAWLDRQAAITSHQWESYHNGMMREWMAKTVELQEQVDELTAERDNLKDNLIDERGKLNRKMNALREVTREYRNERDHYRSKFGKCLDYADAIHALMDDEGVA